MLRKNIVPYKLVSSGFALYSDIMNAMHKYLLLQKYRTYMCMLRAPYAYESGSKNSSTRL